MINLAQLPADVLRTQIGNGFTLMLLGMAIVFVFLTILVFTTKIVSKIVKKFVKEAPKAAVVSAPAASVVPQNAINEGEIAAAVLAAYAKSKN